ncbi:MAG: hypothetical protein LBI13_03715 [Streptococcaceae bacterium]|jgi:hypothetical protein|nr:hypothetical protein [Streptococcaceae bacterium]
MKKKTKILSGLLALGVISGGILYGTQTLQSQKTTSRNLSQTSLSSSTQNSQSSSMQSSSKTNASASSTSQAVKTMSNFNAGAVENGFYIGTKNSKGELKLSKATESSLIAFEKENKGKKVTFTQMQKDGQPITVISLAD